MTVQQITKGIDFEKITNAIPESDVDRQIIHERVERLKKAQDDEYEQAAILLTLIGVTAKRWSDSRETAAIDAAKMLAWQRVCRRLV